MRSRANSAKQKRVLVTTHQKPDGDAMGSVLAVVRACAAAGVHAEGWVVDPCEGNLRAFEGATKVTHVDPRAPRLPEGEFDLVVVVDTGAWTQLEVIAPWLRERVERVIGFDHHARGDDVAARRVVDVSCGSCTALLVGLVEAMNVELAEGADGAGRHSIAEALYIGTCGPRRRLVPTSRTPAPRSSNFAARLLAAGVDEGRAAASRLEQSSRAGTRAAPGAARSRASRSWTLRQESAVEASRSCGCARADFTESRRSCTRGDVRRIVNVPMEVRRGARIGAD
jgi:phosphoesterase RecJ-like protein